eukprot:TRINITY_DN9043_c0_g1_i1.p1 TRINITY_DN9043_c0_g1~~TRINITY_DN9043_c0_g1_i1.p1  ORF type:complete len:317 (-),score=81.84 TRINITY_DN9043_c0_g1_i1:38-988(-)
MSLSDALNNPLFAIAPPVLAALQQGLPVVALESTLISHGLPWPENKSVGLELEEIVKSAGAVPATIAIMGGKIRIGLSADELETLAKPESEASKVSRRDIAMIIAKKSIGATTVAATSLLASKCGIHVFATGGVGGVHRGGELSMDVSADLTELGRTPIAVVSAGIKSILDIGRTLEYLETQGVTVVGFGTENYPSFFTRDSGFKAPCVLNSAEECAALLHANLSLDLNSGVLISVPIPEEAAADGGRVEIAVKQSLDECEEQKIIGRDITPYILKRVAKLTDGHSLTANLALIRNNCRVASAIAVELSKLKLASQ